MKLEFSIERLTENDVISTSGKKGVYAGECYKFTKDTIAVSDPDQRFDAATGKTNDGFVRSASAFNNYFKNAGTKLQADVWYAMYKDGTEFYFYECDCSDHPNADPHPTPVK